MSEKPEVTKGNKLRAWHAAKSNRLLNDWVMAPTTINRDIRAGLRILRARSREEAQNNDHMKKFLQMVQTNVVGHKGIVLQAKPKDPDGTVDQLAADAIEAAWKDWGQFGSCDLSGKHSWRSIQNLFARSAPMDGEVFIYIEEEADVNKYGFALKFLDPDLIDTQYNVEEKNGIRVVMGVELDRNDRALAFYVKESNDYYRDYTKSYTRIPAGKILHCYLPDWIDSARGVPWASQSLLRMGMLAGYEEAELVAARVAAAKMGFFTTDSGGQYQGDDTDEKGNLIMDAEAGAFEQLPEGVNFQSYDPQHPTTAFGDFVKSNLRSVASGLGVSYNSMANDLEGVNYSSLRQGAIDERSTWMLLQEWMIETFVNRVYRLWLRNALQRGQIQVMGRPLKYERFEKFADVTWQARRWQWVDPYKEIQAHQKAIDLGIKSRSEVIRETGRDPEEVWQEIAKERARMEELGIPYDSEESEYMVAEDETE